MDTTTEQGDAPDALSNMTLHRELQLYELEDRASHERVAYYCRAIKAVTIGNRGACAYFTQKAQQWERIRIACSFRLRPFSRRKTS